MHAGVLQVSCWASCFHDVMADWSHDQCRAERSPVQQAAASDTQGWVPAAAPTADSFHLIFCANAGLPAYASWLPTLQELGRLPPGNSPQHNRSAAAQQAQSAVSDGLADDAHPAVCADREGCVGVPVVFSDYCEEAAYMSAQVVQQMMGKTFTLPCCLNPFRDPVPACSHGTRLPACSNGYLFGWL